jgi:hypothetical protein
MKRKKEPFKDCVKAVKQLEANNQTEEDVFVEGLQKRIEELEKQKEAKPFRYEEDIKYIHFCTMNDAGEKIVQYKRAPRDGEEFVNRDVVTFALNAFSDNSKIIMQRVTNILGHTVDVYIRFGELFSVELVRKGIKDEH